MLISTTRAAQKLHVDPRTTRRWLESGKLRGVLVGNTWMVEERDCDQLAEQRQAELDAMVADAHQRAVAERGGEA